MSGWLANLLSSRLLLHLLLRQSLLTNLMSSLLDLLLLHHLLLLHSHFLILVGCLVVLLRKLLLLPLWLWDISWLLDRLCMTDRLLGVRNYWCSAWIWTHHCNTTSTCLEACNILFMNSLKSTLVCVESSISISCSFKIGHYSICVSYLSQEFKKCRSTAFP